MIYISHRGNIDGCCNEENNPSRIMRVIEDSFDVEVDVWRKSGVFWLGHDKPIYKIEDYFLIRYKEFLWCHAKDLNALTSMLTIGIRCFWHETDSYTLVSTGEIWSYVGVKQNCRTICVLPEKCNYSLGDIKGSYGICSDNIGMYKERFKN